MLVLADAKMLPPSGCNGQAWLIGFVAAAPGAGVTAGTDVSFTEGTLRYSLAARLAVAERRGNRGWSTMFTPLNLFGSVIFGMIGMAAFGYGKKAGRLNSMLFGAALMIYPYFVDQAWLLYGVGITLTGLLLRFPE
jgi:hypothetical protein